MNEETSNYKSVNTLIFSIFYGVQGINNGIWAAVIPVYIYLKLGTVDLALLLLINAINSIPWTLKFLVGIINDKWGSKRWGRRFPFIISFGCFGGLFWILMGLSTPSNDSLYVFLLFYGLMTNIGLGIADTSIDGLMLDVTPKAKLGIVQAFTWGIALMGMGVGGFVLAVIFTNMDAIPMLFIMEGVAMILSCILPFLISETPIPEEVHVWRDLKDIFGKRDNWKVFLYSMFGQIPYSIVTVVFGYVVMISINLVSIEQAKLSILAGEPTDFYTFNFIFNVALGIGVLVGLYSSGKLSDRNRKLSVYIAHLIYVPFCVVSIFFLGLIPGLIGFFIFGIGQSWLVISGQAIRADLAKNDYPELQSTYYALMVSFINIGISLGNFSLAVFMMTLGVVIQDFFVLIFLILCFQAIIQLLSFLFFRAIDPKKYEFTQHLNKINK